jgi:hypothetical protein
MRLGRHDTSRSRRWASALLALLSLAPIGALQSESAPCSEPVAAALARAAPAAVRTARAGGGSDCMPCCRSKTAAPSAPAKPTVSCGCCLRGPLPEPTRSPAPASAFDLIATAAGSEGVLLVALPATAASDLRWLARESAPPARLLHCVHRI